VFASKAQASQNCAKSPKRNPLQHMRGGSGRSQGRALARCRAAEAKAESVAAEPESSQKRTRGEDQLARRNDARPASVAPATPAFAAGPRVASVIHFPHTARRPATVT